MVKRIEAKIQLSENDLALLKDGQEITRNGVQISLAKATCTGPTITPSTGMTTKNAFVSKEGDDDLALGDGGDSGD